MTVIYHRAAPQVRAFILFQDLPGAEADSASVVQAQQRVFGNFAARPASNSVGHAVVQCDVTWTDPSAQLGAGPSAQLGTGPPVASMTVTDVRPTEQTTKNEMNNFLAGLIVGVIVTLVFVRLAHFMSIMLPWQRAMLSGAPVTLISVLRMRLHGCPVAFLIDAFCALKHAGHEVTMRQVESCYIAHKHEVNENNMPAFLDMVQEFVEQDAADASEQLTVDNPDG